MVGGGATRRGLLERRPVFLRRRLCIIYFPDAAAAAAADRQPELLPHDGARTFFLLPLAVLPQRVGVQGKEKKWSVGVLRLCDGLKH